MNLIIQWMRRVGCSWPFCLMFFVVIALIGVPWVRAQGFGSIVGRLTDSTGAVVPNTAVTATAVQSKLQTTVSTNGNGEFIFPTLLPTQYSISVSANGFQGYVQTGIVMQANQSATINIKLLVGSAQDTIRVTADAPQVDTTSGTLSQVIDQSRVVDLPLNGRNAASLISLVAGVAAAPNNGLDQGSTKTFPAAVSVTANGTQVKQSNYLLNGGNNLDEMTNANAPFLFPMHCRSSAHKRATMMRSRGKALEPLSISRPNRVEINFMVTYLNLRVTDTSMQNRTLPLAQFSMKIFSSDKCGSKPRLVCSRTVYQLALRSEIILHGGVTT